MHDLKPFEKDNDDLEVFNNTPTAFSDDREMSLLLPYVEWLHSRMGSWKSQIRSC